MRFESKRDFLHKILLHYVGILFLLVSLVICVLSFINSFSIGDFIFAIMFLLFYLLSQFVWKQFIYEIKNREVRVSIGSFCIYEEYISKIVSIRKGAKGTYTYGLSTETITLTILDKEVRVSPEDVNGFIKELLKYNSKIKVEGSLIKAK